VTLSFALVNLGVVAACMLALWILSLVLRNASIADPFWGTGFVILAWVTFFRTGEASPRAVAMLAMVTIWGVRLSLYLLARNLPHGEDFRYADMRRGHGARFWWVSLFTVFSFQGILMWMLATPIELAIADKSAVWSILDVLGAAMWLAGISFEAIADAQLARFKRDPSSKGKVMDRGLWSWSRHPNYFGETLLWWGYGLIAVSAGVWALVAPLAMTVLLLRVSGVTLLEKTIGERRPGYAEYAKRTSAFIPLPPKR